VSKLFQNIFQQFISPIKDYDDIENEFTPKGFVFYNGKGW
jgi:hypothetical protein